MATLHSFAVTGPCRVCDKPTRATAVRRCQAQEQSAEREAAASDDAHGVRLLSHAKMQGRWWGLPCGAENTAARDRHDRRRDGCPPLDRMRGWRCKSEVNDADQDIAKGDAEEGGKGHRKQRQGECAAGAAAAVRGAGRSDRPRTAAPGRGG